MVWIILSAFTGGSSLSPGTSASASPRSRASSSSPTSTVSGASASSRFRCLEQRPSGPSTKGNYCIHVDDIRAATVGGSADRRIAGNLKYRDHFWISPRGGVSVHTHWRHRWPAVCSEKAIVESGGSMDSARHRPADAKTTVSIAITPCRPRPSGIQFAEVEGCRWHSLARQNRGLSAHRR